MKEHVDLSKNFKDLGTRIQEAGDDFGKKKIIIEWSYLGWSQDDIRTYTGMLLHCADLSGPTKEFSIAKEWSIKINIEFTNQVSSKWSH